MLKELQIDQNKCTGCRECLDVCFTNVIAWDEEADKPYGKYKEDCQVCCICEAACPAKAITVIPDWANKYYPNYISTQGGR